MTNTAAPKQQFKGFSAPNYTQVPDELFDDLMTELSGAELKVLLYIIRRTFGFKKTEDNISLSQMLNGIKIKSGEVLDKGTGLSKKTLLAALNTLEEKNIIVTERRRSAARGNEPTAYRLNIVGFVSKNTEVNPPSEIITPTLGVKIPPSPRSNNSPIQETVLQQTDLQYRNSNSKIESNNSKDNKGHQKFQTIGNIIKERIKPKAVPIIEVPESLKVTIQDISQEFGEPRNSHSNLTRVINLFQKSGKNINTGTDYLYQARSITKQQGSVRKNMPYFFEVLEDLMGLKNNATFSFPKSR